MLWRFFAREHEGGHRILPVGNDYINAFFLRRPFFRMKPERLMDGGSCNGGKFRIMACDQPSTSKDKIRRTSVSWSNSRFNLRFGQKETIFPEIVQVCEPIAHGDTLSDCFSLSSSNRFNSPSSLSASSCSLPAISSSLATTSFPNISFSSSFLAACT